MIQSRWNQWILFSLTCIFFLSYILELITPLYTTIPFLLLTLGTFLAFPKFRIPLFLLFIIWVYAFAGNAIPQQVFRQASLAKIKRTPEDFIKAGKLIFNGKGKCSTCHSIGPSKKARCPDLLKASREAGTRKSGMTAREYIIESVYKPSAFIVQGYPKIMPVIWKPPIGLTPLEIETVIAYVISLSGREVDVTPITPPVSIQDARESSERKQLLEGDPKSGKSLFMSGKGKCLACHKLFEKGGGGIDEDASGVGPDLSEIASMNTIAYLEESILRPNAKIVKGYEMVDFRTKENTRVEGILLHETNETLKIKSKESVTRYKKDNIQIRTLRSNKDRSHPLKRGYFWLQAKIQSGKTVEGKIVNVNADTIVLAGAGDTKKVIQKTSIQVMKGKRIRRTSKMPAYDHVLTVKEFSDLLAFLQTLKGNKQNVQ